MDYGVGIISNEPVRDVVRRVQLAEELGYKSAWLIDSQLTCREMYVTLAACAIATSSITLASGVTAPTTRHSTVTASAFSTLNEIAEGRLILGVSVGNSLAKTVGERPAKISELENYVTTVRKLLNNEAVEFNKGIQGRINYLNRSTDIPIYVAASGPKLTKAAGRIADGVLLHYGAVPAQVQEGVALARMGSIDAGRSPDAMDTMAWVITSVSDNPDLARLHVQGRILTMLAMIDISRFNEYDRRVIEAIRETYDFSRLANAGSSPLPELDRFIDRYALAGSPEEVAYKVQQLRDIPEISQVVITLPPSGGSYPTTDSIMKNFAKAVIAA